MAPIMTKYALLVLWIIYTTELSVSAQNLGEYLYFKSHVSEMDTRSWKNEEICEGLILSTSYEFNAVVNLEHIFSF